MSQPADARLIGLFVLGALALAVVLVLAFGGGGYFGKVQKYTAYFEGSVNGLNVGAAVKLKGVSIGRVKDVLVQYDMEHNRVLTPVVLEIDMEKVMATYDSQSTRHHHPALKDLIDRGLRARLSLHSLVTGQLYVDINFLPDQPGNLVGEQSLGLPEIPTVVSSKEEIEKTLQQLASEVRDMPLKETVEAMHDAIRRVEHLLAKPETSASIDNLNQTLKDLQHLVRHLDGKVDTLTGVFDRTAKDGQTLINNLNQRLPNLLDPTAKAMQDGQTLMKHLNQRLPPLLDSTEKAMGAANGALSSVESLTEPGSELSNALRDISEAARSLRALADSLERNPDNLLFGRKKQDDEE